MPQGGWRLSGGKGEPLRGALWPLETLGTMEAQRASWVEQSIGPAPARHLAVLGSLAAGSPGIFRSGLIILRWC